jgi:DNA repair protein RecO (recombination protein O)
MIEWRDTGILLSARPHGESSAIVEVFTETQGRHAGVVRGGTSRRMAPVLQPGAQIDVTWRARLAEHIGAFTVEPQRARAAQAMADRRSLAGLQAVTALLGFCLPERAPHPALYHRSSTLLDLLPERDLWPLGYLRWELALLSEMGFGLDLSACAATGATEGLAYVSPRTGRAVSAAGAGDWADRLLPLPLCLLGEGAAEDAEVALALGTTGHFLHHHLAPHLGDRAVPEARRRFVDLLARRAA